MPKELYEAILTIKETNPDYMTGNDYQQLMRLALGDSSSGNDADDQKGLANYFLYLLAIDNAKSDDNDEDVDDSTNEAQKYFDNALRFCNSETKIQLAEELKSFDVEKHFDAICKICFDLLGNNFSNICTEAFDVERVNSPNYTLNVLKKLYSTPSNPVHIKAIALLDELAQQKDHVQGCVKLRLKMTHFYRHLHLKTVCYDYIGDGVFDAWENEAKRIMKAYHDLSSNEHLNDDERGQVHYGMAELINNNRAGDKEENDLKEEDDFSAPMYTSKRRQMASEHYTIAARAGIQKAEFALNDLGHTDFLFGWTGASDEQFNIYLERVEKDPSFENIFNLWQVAQDQTRNRPGLAYDILGRLSPRERAEEKILKVLFAKCWTEDALNSDVLREIAEARKQFLYWLERVGRPSDAVFGYYQELFLDSFYILGNTDKLAPVSSDVAQDTIQGLKENAIREAIEAAVELKKLQQKGSQKKHFVGFQQKYLSENEKHTEQQKKIIETIKEKFKQMDEELEAINSRTIVQRASAFVLGLVPNIHGFVSDLVRTDDNYSAVSSESTKTDSKKQLSDLDKQSPPQKVKVNLSTLSYNTVQQHIDTQMNVLDDNNSDTTVKATEPESVVEDNDSRDGEPADVQEVGLRERSSDFDEQSPPQKNNTVPQHINTQTNVSDDNNSDATVAATEPENVIDKDPRDSDPADAQEDEPALEYEFPAPPEDEPEKRVALHS